MRFQNRGFPGPSIWNRMKHRLVILVPFVTSPGVDWQKGLKGWTRGLRLHVSLTGRRHARRLRDPAEGKIHLIWNLLYCRFLQAPKFHSSDSTSSVRLICFMQLGCWKTNIRLKLATVQCRRNSVLTVYKPVIYTSGWLKLNTTQRVPLLLCFCLSVSLQQNSSRKIISTIFFIEILYSSITAVKHEEELLTAAARSVV